MIYISHRGNLEGPNKKRENSPKYIEEALSLGFEVEVDVWFTNNDFYLGHDKPVYKIDPSFLINKRLWCHAKNFNALSKMLSMKSVHCFWHQNDKYTITSRGIIWAFPSQPTDLNSICVMPEILEYRSLTSPHSGICSDFIKILKEKI